MPIYEYACDGCGHQTEIMHKISDPPVTECPACHAETLVKQVSAAGFRLKGGGWYETDFKNGGKRNVAGESADSGGSAAGSQSGNDSGGESKSHSCATGGCGCAPQSSNKSSSDSSTSSPASNASPSAD
jgi:putative FmdB family regulatory protein